MDIESVEKFCSTLPHAKAEIKWKSDLVFMIAKKMFCVVDLDAVPASVAFKVPQEDFEELAATEYFIPAPYFAQHKWVTLTDINRIAPVVLKAHIRNSYDLVKAKLPKKVLSELGFDNANGNKP